MPVKVFVLDTSAIMGGFAPGLSDAELITVKDVLEEARNISSKLELETAVMLGKVKVLEPSADSMQKVKELARKTGDQISGTDSKLLALSLDMKEKGGILLSDDYAIQNLAVLLDIPYQRISMPGITRVFKWVAVCPACGREYPSNTAQCPDDGSKLKRKPKKAYF